MMDWNSFGREDIKAAFRRQGHTVVTMAFSKAEPRHDEAAEKAMTSKIREESPDIVFSFNYFPVIAVACKTENVTYVSWVYDSPYVLLYSYTVIFPTNHIFLFDRSWVEEFHRNRIDTVQYMPMAADAERLTALCGETSDKENEKYREDIAFVGSLYRDSHDFYHRMTSLSPYTRGYLEAVMNSQMQVYGADVVEKSLTPDIIADMQKALPMETYQDGVESLSYLYGQYVIDREITARERSSLLGEVASRFRLAIYSQGPEDILPGAVNRGTVDYYCETPLVFHNTKINLNITLRSIKSGMPLRIFEIMGAGGFLMTNWQADFDGSFAADEDYVYFGSREELISKCAYYLAPEHEAERAGIARSGLDKMLRYNTYDCRVREMLGSL